MVGGAPFAQLGGLEPRVVPGSASRGLVAPMSLMAVKERSVAMVEERRDRAIDRGGPAPLASTAASSDSVRRNGGEDCSAARRYIDRGWPLGAGSTTLHAKSAR